MNNRQLIVILTFCTTIIVAQTESNYKNFSDTIFQNGDKIITPEMFFLNSNLFKEKRFTDSADVIAKFLFRYPNFMVELGGHTDNRGNPDALKSLSFWRAQSIQDYLVKVKNINIHRIIVKGYGGLEPIISDKTIKSAKTKIEKDSLYQINRRFEIKILATN